MDEPFVWVLDRNGHIDLVTEETACVLAENGMNDIFFFAEYQADSPEEIWDTAMSFCAHKLDKLLGMVEKMDGSEISYKALLGRFNPYRKGGPYAESGS